jgi:hypothetical protein
MLFKKKINALQGLFFKSRLFCLGKAYITVGTYIRLQQNKRVTINACARDTTAEKLR